MAEQIGDDDADTLQFLKVKADARLIKIMHAQFKKAQAENDEYITYAIDENDPRIFYFMIRNVSGNHDEYVGGEFIFKLVAPNDFPNNPPKIYVISRNGVYASIEEGGGRSSRVCISIGEYHADQYRPALGMKGFAINMLSGLIGWETLGPGLNLVKTTIDEKKRIARESFAYNRRMYPGIVKMFEDQNPNLYK